MARYEFMLTGHADTAADLEENVNGFGGKRMLEAIRHRLVERGYEYDPEVGAEDWGWYFDARRNGRTYLCGAHVMRDAGDGDGDTTEAQAFLDHQRGLLDKLFGRNKADPTVDAAADLLAVLAALPGVTKIHKTVD
jgi:hypothetical protein